MLCPSPPPLRLTFPGLRNCQSTLMLTPFSGTTKQITISTETKKNVPIYNLAITISSPKSGKPQTMNLSRSFTEWFDETGHFVVTPFQSMLATSVPVVGTLDPSRVNADTKETTPAANNAVGGAEYTAEELDAILAATGADANTAEVTGSSAKKGGKRRKV